MPRTSCSLISAALLTALLAVGCASHGPKIADRLDPDTGVTVISADAPMVFYRDRSSRAAYARDFVSMGPLAVNRMGDYRYYLWVAVWGTMPDAGGLAEALDGFETLVLVADGEPLPLDASAWSSATLGLSESSYIRPAGSAAEVYYELTLDQLRLVAASENVRLQTSGPEGQAFEPWEGQAVAHAAFRDFVEHVAH